MTGSVDNSSLLSNRSLHVGVLTPPNELHKPVLYSHTEADRQFKQLEKDIYQTEKSQKFENKRKTPVSVFLTICAAAVASGYLVFKKALKW